MVKRNYSSISLNSISIGERELINNLEIDLNPGDIKLIKAPNGTGKSVLLSILSGWDEEITSISVKGNLKIGTQGFYLPNDLTEYRKYAKKRISYLSHKLYEESLGIKFGEEINFLEKKNSSIPDLIQNSLTLLKTKNDNESLVEKMAKGHRQLMALIDVFSDYKNHDIILLDEPTSYLSDYHFENFLQQIKFISETSNSAILIASNDIRLLNQNFSYINLKNQERETKNINLLFQEVPLLPNIESVSIKIKGYPLGNNGQLPFYFNSEIKEEESIILVGANGSGKSTFLNVCSGLMRINGVIEHRSSDKKIKTSQLFPNYLSLLFQEPSNYEFRNTADEILYVFDKIKDNHFFNELYEIILSYFSIPKNQNPKTLSSGQLRILWLVSMLGWSGRWILDEPDASLDEKSLELFFRLMDIHIANKGTVIIVTHNKELYKKYNFRTIEL